MSYNAVAMVECSHVAEAVSLTVEQVKNIQPQHWACAGGYELRVVELYITCALVQCSTVDLF